ncbi:hypothetical protein BGZ83_009373 [Gryganskiella cystojenkinii]|nr:hypothetical protein BGZ83_009373 [Gryganskiella cystojenkinii]
MATPAPATTANTTTTPSRHQYWCHQARLHCEKDYIEMIDILTCAAEMTPMLVPDPMCPHCHSEFVEKIEEDNDPRTFVEPEPEDEDGHEHEAHEPVSLEDLFQLFQAISNPARLRTRTDQQQTQEQRSTQQQLQQQPGEFPSGGNPFGISTFQLGPRPSTTRSGSRSAQNSNVNEDQDVDMEDPDDDHQHHHQHEHEQMQSAPMSLATLLAQLGMDLRLSAGGSGAGFGGGLFNLPGNPGDYVFSQGGLDDVITRMMEMQSRSGPVGASEEIIDSIPQHKMTREELDAKTECSVCKDEFVEQDACLQLKCKHIFHEDCIKPWLKTSATCPTCRSSLLPESEETLRQPPQDSTGSSASGSPSLPGSFPSTDIYGSRSTRGSRDEDLFQLSVIPESGQSFFDFKFCKTTTTRNQPSSTNENKRPRQLFPEFSSNNSLSGNNDAINYDGDRSFPNNRAPNLSLHVLKMRAREAEALQRARRSYAVPAPRFPLSSNTQGVQGRRVQVPIQGGGPPQGRQKQDARPARSLPIALARQLAPREVLATEKMLRQEFIHFSFLPRKPAFKPLASTIDYLSRDPYIMKFSYMLPPPLPASLDLDCFEYVDTCTPVQMNHLRLFNRRSRELPIPYQSSFEKACDHVAGLLDLPEKLPMPKIKDLGNVRFDGTKFSGMEYARQNLGKRRDAHPVALKDAREAWNKLMTGQRVQPHDARLGGKGKLIERKRNEYGLANTDGSSISMGRLILMLSHRDYLMLAALEKPLTRAYLDKKWPIHIGQGWYHGGCEDFINKMTRHQIYHCFDAKKFDAAIDGWLVSAAIRILRRQYRDGMNPKYDSLWAFVYESLVDVVICRDDGIRMQKRCGTTSGNSFNTLVQSIITLLLGYTALIDQAQIYNGASGVEDVLKKCEIEVLGDDMVMALPSSWSFLGRSALSHVVKEAFNVDWSGMKSFTTDRLMDSSEPGTEQFKGIHFLGMYFRHQRWGRGNYAPKIVIPYRPFQESYLSLLFPKHGNLTREHAWLRALGVYLNAAGNKTTREWLDKYLDFLELGPSFERPAEWPTCMDQHHTRYYLRLGRGKKAKKPRRLGYEQWIRLVCQARKVEDRWQYEE